MNLIGQQDSSSDTSVSTTLLHYDTIPVNDHLLATRVEPRGIFWLKFIFEGECLECDFHLERKQWCLFNPPSTDTYTAFRDYLCGRLTNRPCGRYAFHSSKEKA